MADDTCLVLGCSRRQFARRWCYVHWKRWRTTGDVQADKPIRARQADKPANARCSIAGCERPHQARDLCRTHYSRFLRGQDVNAPAADWAVNGGPCRSVGCGRVATKRGHCATHYSRIARRGTDADPAPVSDKELAARAESRRQYVLQWKREQYAARAAEMRLRTVEWRRNNPERVKLHDKRKRCSRRTARHVPFTADQLAQKLDYWGRKCWVCQGPYEAVDHVKPLSRGGWHMLANIRPICTSCNSRKHNRWPYSVPLR